MFAVACRSKQMDGVEDEVYAVLPRRFEHGDEAHDYYLLLELAEPSESYVVLWWPDGTGPDDPSDS